MQKLEIDEEGNRRWYNKKHHLHRLDGPAVEWINGNKYWYQNGKSHRIDGPAIEYKSGTKYWYNNGELHRLDGPACEHSTGIKEWWIDDIRYSEKSYNAKIRNR